MAHHGARQVHQPVGDAAHVHEVRGQQEERHRQQDERVVGLEGLVEEREGREARLDHEDRQAREPERERHGHAQRSAERRSRRRGSRRPIRPRARRPVMRRAGRTAMRGSLRPRLAEEQQPGEPGDRPGHEDDAHRQLGELRGLVPAEAHELDAPPDEHQREHERRPALETMRSSAFGRGASSGQTSTSKWVCSRTPIIAPSMIIQTKRKRESSSVQI